MANVCFDVVKKIIIMQSKNVLGVTKLTNLVPCCSLQMQNLYLFCQSVGIMKLRTEIWELLMYVALSMSQHGVSLVL